MVMSETSNYSSTAEMKQLQQLNNDYFSDEHGEIELTSGGTRRSAADHRPFTPQSNNMELQPHFKKVSIMMVTSESSQDNNDSNREDEQQFIEDEEEEDAQNILEGEVETLTSGMSRSSNNRNNEMYIADQNFRL